MSDPSGVRLTTVGSRMEAEELCGMLRTNGIKCGYALSNTAAGIAMVSSGVSNFGPVDVYVEKDQHAQARELLPPSD